MREPPNKQESKSKRGTLKGKRPALPPETWTILNQVFCRSFPWLDEEFWHESIEGQGRAVSVRREARRGRNASRGDLSQGRDQPGDILQLEKALCGPSNGRHGWTGQSMAIGSKPPWFRCWCPNCTPGEVVIMDHLSSAAKERIEAVGATLCFLQSDSPDFNPI
jgi:hypothetical protein